MEFYNEGIQIRILDNAGQEQYRAIFPGIIKKADIILFIRDNTSSNLDDWLDLIKGNKDIESEDAKLILCLKETKKGTKNPSIFCFSSKNDNE